MTTNDRASGYRERRASEKGQMLTLVILIMGTFLVLAVVPITVGQMLVRRKQAQMIVDVAALAGAQQQAKALNTMARLNEKGFNVLNGIIMGHIPYSYMDSNSTTSKRRDTAGTGGKDWVKDLWKDFHKAFKAINDTIDRVNQANSTMAYPRASARRIIAENFGGANTLFHDEQPLDHGVGALVGDVPMVKLTTPKKHKTGGLRLYAPFIGHSWAGGCTTPCNPYPSGWLCCAKNAWIGICYGVWNVLTAVKSGFYTDGESYELGKFYNNSVGHDVRFSYYLVVPATSPLVGKVWFRDIPPIVVMATAKPFGGYLGTDYKKPSFNIGNIVMWTYTQKSGKEISYTYKAKLVETTWSERTAVAGKVAVFAGVGDFDLDTLERYTYTVTH